MSTWTNEIPYGGAIGSTYDGPDKGDGLNTWDSLSDSWDGQTITIWTNQNKSS